MTRGRFGERRGFVLPLALFIMTVGALLAALMLQSSVDELRVARGDVASARAQAAAESALADVLVAPPDSAVSALRRGEMIPATIAGDGETTKVVVQGLGGGLVRVSVGARVWSGGVRADAVNVAFLRIVSDSAGGSGGVRYQRLPGWWWAQIP